MLETHQAVAQAQSAAPAKAPEMLARLNAVAVTAELLARGEAACADLPPEKRVDFDQRMHALLRALQSETPRAQLMLVAMAVDFRLRALTRLVEATFIQGCEVDFVTQRYRLSAAALEVASDEPLVRNSAGLAAFDLRRFKSRLLH